MRKILVRNNNKQQTYFNCYHHVARTNVLIISDYFKHVTGLFCFLSSIIKRLLHSQPEKFTTNYATTTECILQLELS